MTGNKKEESALFLVSACLLGEPCKYNGGDNFSRRVRDFIGAEPFVLICPEVLGGLPVPRPPAEIYEGRVVTADGKDVTAAFVTGARRALSIAKETKPALCILKENSPSCGSHFIYDGKFRQRKVPGQGTTAKLLMAHGFQVVGEEEI